MIRKSAFENLNTSKHFVRFYEDDDALVKEIGYFIGTGLAAGDGGIIVATKAHVHRIEERLTASGCDLVAAREHEQYVSLDAAEALSKFIVNGWPDEQRFVSEVGSLLIRMEMRHSKVRAFGEMVSLLWAEELYEAALHLEQLWNDLIARRACTLFCAYRMADFNTDAADLRFKDVCMQHSQVLLSGTGTQ
jgi:hypothetical protein